jgi:alpha-galactosidase
MLESYVQNYPAPRLENLRYVLRSGMLGWFSLMLDASQWTAQQREAAQREFALYKARLRPLIRTADVYHVADRPDGVHWDGMEYYSPEVRHGVLYAFRGSASDLPTHRFRLTGLDRGRRYRLEFQDNPAANRELTGESLMQMGVDVRLALPLSSDLIFFEEVP